MRRPAAIAAALLPALLPGLLCGCVWGPGEPFVELVQVELQVEVDGGGAAAARGARLALQALEGGVSFDPADPPEGYGLCHNGHCHKDDGTLPTYEQIEAELAGDAATWTDELRTSAGDADSGGGAVGLLPGPVALPVSTISRALLTVDALEIEQDGARTALGPLELPADFSLVVDREAPARARLVVTLTVLPATANPDADDPVEGDTGAPADGGAEAPARAEVLLVELP